MEPALLGIAVCDSCNSRIRIQPKHEPLLGKSVRCPKCRELFTLSLQSPTNTEAVAVAAQQQAAEQAEQQQKQKRRSKNEIRTHHVDRAMSGLRTLHGRLRNLCESESCSEEQVRIWCIDALRVALGYVDGQLDTECNVLGSRVDIAIKHEGRVMLVIECKNLRSKLGSAVRNQAGIYAATLSAPWAVTTNGDIWKLYRVCPRHGQAPHMELVFDVSLLDEDGISDLDAENLYLLTARAMTTGDTEREFHSVACAAPSRIYETLFTERVLKAIRKELTDTYHATENVRATLEEDSVEARLREMLSPLEM